MELRNLKSYIKVCENKSFSKAAEQLGYAQSTITAQINQLEQELGINLFDRNGKQFQLNTKGEELLSYANRLVSLSEEAISSLSDASTPKGLLRIGVIESVGAFFLPDILGSYLMDYPLVQVQIRTATTLEIMTMLQKNQIDLMLTLDEKVYDTDWQCPWMRKEKILFLCSPNHPFASRNSIPLEEVLSENMLLTEPRCNYRQTFEHICSEHGMSIRSSLEIGCTDTILDFTRRGIGLSFLPELTAQDLLKEKKLSTFSIENVDIQMYIQLIYRKSKWFSPSMEAFLKKVTSFDIQSSHYDIFSDRKNPSA